jgi:hypothetical protein
MSQSNNMPIPTASGAPVYTKQESAVQGARFKVGDTLYLVTFQYGSLSAPDKDIYSHTPFYGGNQGADLFLKDILFTEVEITDHYLVNWEHDEIEIPPRYHGFAVIDRASGDIWTNQYPKATFSQTSDDADWQFRNLNRGQPGNRRRSSELLHVMTRLHRVTNDPILTAAERREFMLRMDRLESMFEVHFPTKWLKPVTAKLGEEEPAFMFELLNREPV